MVDWRAVGNHYVLYQLARQGCACSHVEKGIASIVACNEDGTRVALVAVKVRQRRQAWLVNAEERQLAKRNLSYVFVDFSADQVPPCFVVSSSAVARVLAENLSWPGDAWTARWLEPHRNAWHVLGLDRPGLAVAS
jgi:hypothetical protein